MNIQVAFTLIHLLYKNDVSDRNKSPGSEPEGIIDGSKSNECSEESARQFLAEITKRRESRFYKHRVAAWAYESNITDTNLKNKLAVEQETAEEEKADWLKIQKVDLSCINDYDIKRQFRKLSKLGSAALSEEKHLELSEVLSKMKSIYSTTKICAYDDPHKCDLRLEPDLAHILAISKNPVELRHIWTDWHDTVGSRCQEYYPKYVKLLNEAARLNNYTDASEDWFESYEDPTMAEQIEKLWQQLKPLYLQIHAYVRTNLRKRFGDLVSEKGPLPAHLLGNMWGQEWRSLAQSMLPYPGKQSEDIGEELRRQSYTPEKLFKTSEDFYKSINLTEMPPLFWKNSILEKPNDREMVCHASAWDFGTGEDVRIKQCTEINTKYFVTTHHEMGHVEYYLQYKHLPIMYRRGANDGFHESIGDTIALSAKSRKHLQKLGLLKSRDDRETILNSMFQTALEKVVFLPFAYLMDLWRWGVFRGEITPDQYNCKWWELKFDYQGVTPPIIRTNKGFDPASKFHIVANVPYLRYFISHVLQFQFHRSLCKIAGEFEENNPDKPLHNCDIYGNTEAGNVFKKMLSMGSSRPWPDAIEVVTGQRTMDASALLEYFKPLQIWLEEENKRNGAFIGWKISHKGCFTVRK